MNALLCCPGWITPKGDHWPPAMFDVVLGGSSLAKIVTRKPRSCSRRAGGGFFRSGFNVQPSTFQLVLG
jgi:hypothetical protein